MLFVVHFLKSKHKLSNFVILLFICKYAAIKCLFSWFLPTNPINLRLVMSDVLFPLPFPTMKHHGKIGKHILL